MEPRGETFTLTAVERGTSDVARARCILPIEDRATRDAGSKSGRVTTAEHQGVSYEFIKKETDINQTTTVTRHGRQQRESF